MEREVGFPTVLERAFPGVSLAAERGKGRYVGAVAVGMVLPVAGRVAMNLTSRKG